MDGLTGLFNRVVGTLCQSAGEVCSMVGKTVVGGEVVGVRESRVDHPWRSVARQLMAVVVTIGCLGQGSLLAKSPEGAPSAKPAKAKGKSGPAGAARPATAAPGATAAEGDEDPQQRVVARVNDQDILWQELADLCVERHGGQVLESLVNKHLILDECTRRGITITQQHVDDEIVEIAGKFKLSAEQWVSMLQKERNISLQQYRNDIIWPTLALRQLAKDRIQVDPKAVDEAFESEYGPKVQVRMITTSSKSAAEAILKEARANPDDFGRIAKDKSEDKNSAAARGLVPPIRRHAGEPALEQVAFGLKPGEISDVLPLHDQFIILKCERPIPAARIAPQFEAEARGRLTDRLRESNLREVASTIFQELQKNVKVVNVWNDPAMRQKMPNVAATINDKPIPMEHLKQACFDRFGPEVLEGEINHRLLKQALAEKGGQVSRTDLDAEIARAAENYGYLLPDGKPDVARWLDEIKSQEEMTVDLYVRDAVWPSVALKKLIGDSVQVTDEDLDKGFQANYGERVEALAIVLNNQRTAQEVWKMARDNPSQAYFGQLANQYSVEPVSRANFGEIPPIGLHGGQPLVEKEAFKLKPGELSGIVATGDKFVILRCLGRTEPVVQPQDREAVREELTKAILEKKLRIAMAEEFDRLKGVAKVQNLLTAVATKTVPTPRVAAQPVSQPKP